MTETVRLKIRTEGEKMELCVEGSNFTSSEKFPREDMVRFAKAIIEADRTGDHIMIEVSDDE